MFGFQTPELIVIMFIVILLFGAKRLPELARSMGGAVREYSEAAKDNPQEKETKNKSGNGDEKEAILMVARYFGIETEGRSISEIAQEISSVAEEKEFPDGEQ